MFDWIVLLYVTADVVGQKACCPSKTIGVVKVIAREKQLALLKYDESFIVLVKSLRGVPPCKPRFEEGGL